jgi:hypothetical protein
MVRDEVVEGAAVMSLRIVGPEGELDAELRFPLPGRDEAPLPIAVVVNGTDADEVVPVSRATTVLAVESGIATLHMDLAGPDWGGGATDAHGPLARSAVATALRWANGSEADSDGCRVTDRLPRIDPTRVVLVGASNGGNLAVAALADADIAAPEPAGLVLWETPAGAEFVNVEHGNLPELYAPGGCARTERGIECPFLDTTLVASGLGLPCFDLDHDGVCEEGEREVGGTREPVSDRQMMSPLLSDLIAESGLDLPGVGDTASALSFWATRDATRMADTLVSNHPNLPVLLVAFDVDHRLYGLDDHPHVFGLGEALQAAGARWTRLNPGMTWSGQGDENEPDMALSLTSPTGWLLPAADVRDRDALAAAVLELADRAADGMWY